MEIIDNRDAPKKVQIKDLSIGDTFEYDGGVVHMKIGSGSYVLPVNAIRLSSGFACRFENSTYVIPLKCKLVIE